MRVRFILYRFGRYYALLRKLRINARTSRAEVIIHMGAAKRSQYNGRRRFTCRYESARTVGGGRTSGGKIVRADRLASSPVRHQRSVNGSALTARRLIVEINSHEAGAGLGRAVTWVENDVFGRRLFTVSRARCCMVRGVSAEGLYLIH